MTLIHIAVFSTLALLYAVLVRGRGRAWALLAISVVAVYWLQPFVDVRYLDFAFPTATLLIAIGGWAATKPRDADTPSPIFTRDDLKTLIVVLGLVLAVAATRYLAPALRPTASRPPPIETVILGLALGLALIYGLARAIKGRQLVQAAIFAIIITFAIFKTDALASWLAALLRQNAGADPNLATPADLTWLGFSYIAFRILHTLRDRQTGQLPDLSLLEYLNYIIFFPALTAGPIDRAERFQEDHRALAAAAIFTPPRWVEGGGRIAVGLMKKFVIADSIALFALNGVNAHQAEGGALWLLLYAYTFRLFFDFSGYSDIAIGIGILFGIKLPENFDRPYLKNNLQSFWQSWHITLSNWARFYIYSPLTRALLRRKPRPSNAAIQFAGHMSTMLVIGLWHGVTWTFIIWGLWHGVGLFIHKMWSDRTRRWYNGLKDKPAQKRLWHGAGVVLTFHFVALGWVWFALPDAQTALSVFVKLFGGA